MGEFVMPGYLNEYQRKAVLDKSSACLVNANVGSGPAGGWRDDTGSDGDDGDRGS